MRYVARTSIAIVRTAVIAVMVIRPVIAVIPANDDRRRIDHGRRCIHHGRRRRRVIRGRRRGVDGISGRHRHTDADTNRHMSLGRSGHPHPECGCSDKRNDLLHLYFSWRLGHHDRVA